MNEGDDNAVQPPMLDLAGLLEALGMPSVGVPNAADRLFPRAAEEHGHARIVHDAVGGWFVYSSGYKDAADIVVNQLKQSQRQQDFLVYPVMFLYRHYLELTIKGLIVVAWRLLDIAAEDDLQTHDIRHYWAMCQTLLREISPGDSVEEQTQIGRLIDEFCKHDASSFAFRYPVTKPDKRTKERALTLDALHIVDLQNVQGVIAKIAVFLSGAEVQIAYYMDCKSDMADYDGPHGSEV